MRKMLSTLLLLLVSAGAQAAAPGVLDAAGYMRQQGWEPEGDGNALKSPVPDVAPLMFYAKGNSVPSCSLLTTAAGAKAPNYIELVGSDPDVGFPQCVGIKSMTLFKLQGKEYLTVGYLARETREDTDIRFHYLVRDQAKGFVTDVALTDAVPSSPSGLHSRDPVAVKPVDGVRLARIAHLTKAYPAWRFMERDFISDKASSFSIFEDKKARRCQFVTEAGAAPVATAHTSFAAADCASVLASARFDKAGKVYYLAMFKDHGGRQTVGVTSVSVDGVIATEKPLADAINRNGATKDMRSAKAALMRAI
jgi:hypothetical protein